MIDICCNVNTINTKEGDDLKITMQIKLQPTKEEMALLDFTMQEYISLVNEDRKSTRLNSSHASKSRMPSSA